MRFQVLAARVRSLPWVETLIVVSAYLALTVLISWPLAANIGTEIAGGGLGGDQSGYVWDFWNQTTNGLQLWGVDNQESVGAPFGRESPASVNFTLFATLGPAFIVASIWSPIVAYNATVFIALTLAGATMYWLVRWVGAGRAPAAWAGAAFIVFPYATLRAQAHIPLTHIWGLPLVILGSLYWLERPSGRRSLILSACFLASWTTSPYYGTMAGIIVASAIVVGAYRAWIVDGIKVAVRRSAEAGGAIIGIVLLPLGLLFSAASGSIDDSLARDPNDLALYGARLSDYFLPPLTSSFFQSIFREDWVRIASPGGERMAFVGYVTLALAAIGAGLVLAGRKRESRMWLAALLAVVALPILVLFSLESPSTFFGRTIDMPSSYLFDVLPYMRAFARFSAAVMALLLVVAAIGLALVMRRMSAPGKVALMSCVLLLGALELPPGAPAGRVIQSDVPLRVQGNAPADVPIWRWLARNSDPDAIIFETPGLPNELIERNFMYGQLVHGRRILNGSLSASQVGWDAQVANGFLDWPGVAERLATLGVEFVTIHEWAYEAAGYSAPDPRDPPAGFSLVTAFPDRTALWRVVAKPASAVAVPRSGGWHSPSPSEGTVWRAMGSTSTTTMFTREAGLHSIRFRARGVGGRTYPTRIATSDGTVLAEVEVGDETLCEFDVDLPEGRSDIIMEVAVSEGTDPALPTIVAEEWRIERVGTP